MFAAHLLAACSADGGHVPGEAPDGTAPAAPATTSAGASETPAPVPFGAAVLLASALKPIKEPVSTTHRALTLGMDAAGSVLAAPPETLSAIVYKGETAALRPDGPTIAADPAAWEATLDALTGTRRTRGTVRFLIDGDAFYPVLNEALEHARDSIDVRLYIFDNDDVAVAAADLLKRRAETLRVRVLLDGIGSAWAAGARADTLPPEHRGPTSIAAYLRRESKVDLRIQANPLFAGDHSKSIIVDDRRAFVGGMNIGREYRYEWHDLMVELRGPVVAHIRRDYESAWGRASPLGDLGALVDWLKRRKPPAAGEGAPLRLLATRPGDDQIRRAKLAAFRRAGERILVETPYLADKDVVTALIDAARRGVDVRLVLPRDNDSSLMARSNRRAAKRMAEAGVRVYVYPGFTHAKAAIVDGWAVFGSANLDWLSHTLNRELDIATSDPAIVARLEAELFDVDLAKSRVLPRPPAPAAFAMAARKQWF